MSSTDSPIQSLQTQLRMQSGAQTSSPTNVAPPTFHFITPITIANGSAACAWTTAQRPEIPASATAVLLDGQFANSSGSATEAFFSIRTGPSDLAARFLGNTISGAAGDTSSYGAQAWFPVIGGTFQWSANTGNMSYIVRIVGYFG